MSNYTVNARPLQSNSQLHKESIFKQVAGNFAIAVNRLPSQPRFTPREIEHKLNEHLDKNFSYDVKAKIAYLKKLLTLEHFFADKLVLDIIRSKIKQLESGSIHMLYPAGALALELNDLRDPSIEVINYKLNEHLKPLENNLEAKIRELKILVSEKRHLFSNKVIKFMQDKLAQLEKAVYSKDSKNISENLINELNQSLNFNAQQIEDKINRYLARNFHANATFQAKANLLEELIKGKQLVNSLALNVIRNKIQQLNNQTNNTMPKTITPINGQVQEPRTVVSFLTNAHLGKLQAIKTKYDRQILAKKELEQKINDFKLGFNNEKSRVHPDKAKIEYYKKQLVHNLNLLKLMKVQLEITLKEYMVFKKVSGAPI